MCSWQGWQGRNRQRVPGEWLPGGNALRGLSPIPRPQPHRSSHRGQERAQAFLEPSRGQLSPSRPPPALGFPLRQREQGQLAWALDFCSETPAWRMVQRAETGAGEEDNGLQVGRRCLSYRRQLGIALQPKNERGVVGTSLSEKSKPFCGKDVPVESWMPLPAVPVQSCVLGPRHPTSKHTHTCTVSEPSCTQTLPEHRAGVTTSDSCTKASASCRGPCNHQQEHSWHGPYC